ncbi:thioredoxin [Candidatus Parcubacteria bacterium]|nr:MAG: thioredoxin [Candidatus Parcubacteria bacterium]
MRNIYIAIFVVLVVALLGYGIMRSNTSKDNELNTVKNGENNIVQDENTNNSVKSGEYINYDPTLLARADNGRVVLFFHASWCPTCKVLDTALNASLTDIPEGLTILKVDYDNSTELKKKYGIAYQHTLVQVDSQGNELAKWSGGSDLNSIVSRLK